MSEKLILGWAINSINQTEQRIYRKLNDGAEELIATLEPDVTVYEDSTATATNPTRIQYRVESVGIYRGQETIESSDLFEFTMAPLGQPMVLRASTNTISFTSDQPFDYKLDNSYYIRSAAGGGRYGATISIPDGAPGLISVRATKEGPLGSFLFNGGVAEITHWYQYGHSDSVDYAFVSGFDEDLTGLPTTLPSGLTNLKEMLADATNFNGNVSGWDVSTVTNMASLFNRAEAFNQPLTGWNTANVENTSEMFRGALAFDQNISNWDLRKVTNGTDMYRESGMNDIAKLAVPGQKEVHPAMIVRGSVGKVAGITSLGEFNVWTTSLSVAQAATIDEGLYSYTTTITEADHPETDIYLKIIFPERAQTVTVSNVEAITQWSGAGYEGVLDTGNFQDKFPIRINAYAEVPFTELPTLAPANTTSLAGLFYLAQGVDVSATQLGAWDTSTITDMSYMFKDAVIVLPSITNWNVSAVADMTSMFGTGAIPSNSDLTGWDVGTLIPTRPADFSGSDVSFEPSVWSVVEE